MTNMLIYVPEKSELLNHSITKAGWKRFKEDLKGSGSNGEHAKKLARKIFHKDGKSRSYCGLDYEVIEKSGGARRTDTQFPKQLSDAPNSQNTRYWITSDGHSVGLASKFEKLGDKVVFEYHNEEMIDPAMGFDDMEETLIDVKKANKFLSKNSRNYTSEELLARDKTPVTIHYQWVPFKPDRQYVSTGNPLGMATSSVVQQGAGIFGLSSTGIGSAAAEATGDLLASTLGNVGYNSAAGESGRYSTPICLELNLSGQGKNTMKTALTGVDLDMIIRGIAVNVNEPSANEFEDARDVYRIKVKKSRYKDAHD